MRFACEQCQTKYTIPDERVRGKILKIRCKNCNCQITISEGGVRTARPIESAGGDTIIPTKNSLPALGEGGDATMIGGMADFFSGPGAVPPPVDEWYVSIDGETAGPIPMQELAQRVVAEEATPGREIFVWREGFKEWLPPPKVDELKSALLQERRSPIKQPRIATKLGLAPISRAHPSAAPAAAAVGGSLMEENEDATQIGSLTPPIGPPATKNEPSGVSLEAVDFDVVTDLPAPPKPQAKPGAAPPPKPKNPPAFKPPPPTPGAPPARPATPAAKPALPKPAPPVESPPPAAPTPAPPPMAAPMAAPMAPPMVAPLSPPAAPMQPPAPATGSTSQSFAPPPAEDPTGALRGSAFSADQGGMASPAMSPDFAGGASGYPQGGMASSPMGGMPADAGGYPQSAPADAPPAASPPSKPPTVLLAILGVVMLLGVSATIWVVTRPSKGSGKTQVVDAGPPADAMPAEAEKPPTEPAAKTKSAKDDLLGITAEQRDAILDKGKKALAGCTSKLLKKEPKLAGTALSVEVTISGKGKIDTVEVGSKDTELDGKAAKCFQKAIKRLKFPKHSDKNAYQIKFGLPLEG